MHSENWPAGGGAHTPPAHASEVPVGAQARTLVVQVVGGTSGVSVDGVQLPAPTAADDTLM